MELESRTGDSPPLWNSSKARTNSARLRMFWELAGKALALGSRRMTASALKAGAPISTVSVSHISDFSRFVSATGWPVVESFGKSGLQIKICHTLAPESFGKGFVAPASKIPQSLEIQTISTPGLHRSLHPSGHCLEV